nr:pentapeptide repeat-containing protein [uncultured Flavobacterium sp.]
MPDYFLDIEYNNLTYGEQDVNLKEFESCTFNHCNFSQCNFIGVVFIDCTFNDCIFSGAKINHVALRTVLFCRCKIEEVNFAMCDKLIFEVHFKECVLDFSKFYTLKIKGTTFIDCSIIAVDFMNTDLTEVIFDNCDLYRSEFSKANLSKAHLKTSYNYTIDPTKTKIKKAVFALESIKGLLFKHDIIVS